MSVDVGLLDRDAYRQGWTGNAARWVLSGIDVLIGITWTMAGVWITSFRVTIGGRVVASAGSVRVGPKARVVAFVEPVACTQELAVFRLNLVASGGWTVLLLPPVESVAPVE
jgi:hypothetical protein